MLCDGRHAAVAAAFTNLDRHGRPHVPLLVTTTIFLVRHGSHDRLDRFLCGRMEGVELSETGRREAVRVAERLSREEIGALYVSPVLRARQTAEPIAEVLGLRPVVARTSTRSIWASGRG